MAVQQRNAAAGTRPINVLVADDSDSLRALVRITLTSQGWSVIEAATAEAARALTREVRPDLVILDITFGDTGPDGLALCAELKADPSTAVIPIVMLTAHEDPAQRRRAEAARADAYVTKPFGPLELMAVLRGVLVAAPETPSLGLLLLDAGAVEATVLEDALLEQRQLVDGGTPTRLGDMLVDRGVVSGAALDRALLEQMHARAVEGERGRVRVLVIDDHLAVREGLKSLIREDPTLEVVGEAADAEQGLRLARRHQPDIVILDNEMPGMSGLELLPTLRAEVPSAKVVVFSLDGDVRERALAAGAHRFVTKDAPMERILEALRPARESGSRPATPTSAPMPALPSAHHLRRAAVVMSATVAAYAALFFVLEPAIGASAGAFSVIPVVAIGVLLGPEAGLLGAILTFLFTAVLWTLTGHVVGEPVISVGSGFGVVVLLLLGFAAGAARVLGLRLDPRRRRVEAIAEAARALSGLDRGVFVDVFLEAMLKLVPGDLALLFSNAAGDARLVSASRNMLDVNSEPLASLARETMRAATARTIDELAEGERPEPAHRSALLMPVSVAGQDVRGVLVILHRDRARFGAAEVSLARPFAQYLWVVLRNAPLSAGRAPTSVRERTN